MTEFTYFWEVMCACYFLGGLTIGYWLQKWRSMRKRRGTGRWDWSNRKFYGAGDQ